MKSILILQQNILKKNTKFLHHDSGNLATVVILFYDAAETTAKDAK
jgi:hypothetical protein